MTLVLTIFAIVGLIIFIVGAVLYLVIRPALPIHPIIMVIGGLVYAIATVLLLFDAVL